MNNNTYLYETDGIDNCIKMIIGQIVITNTKFINQQYIISATGSKVSMNNSEIRDMNVNSKLFRISESDMILGNITMANLLCNHIDNEIFYFVKAYTEFEVINYSDSTCKLINSGLSQIYMKVSI